MLMHPHLHHTVVMARLADFRRAAELERAYPRARPAPRAASRSTRRALRRRVLRAAA
ncbi:MAG TPA: hypothetical protein VHF89_02145 [Solirubrobacteraceae bacterium]|nr:hypothetical protein [Solirubrobacteraceae bacterium]